VAVTNPTIFDSEQRTIEMDYFEELQIVAAGGATLGVQLASAAPFADWVQLFGSAGPMAALVAFFVWQTWQRERHWRDERKAYQDQIVRLEDKLIGIRDQR